ncbi:MAG: SUMF1/EgtB/PvdO family nonheme iron enzyme [Pseudomonadota bacterium]
MAVASNSELQAGAGSLDDSDPDTGEAGLSSHEQVEQLQSLLSIQADQLESLEAERNSLLTISSSLQDEVAQLRHALTAAVTANDSAVEDIVIESPAATAVDEDADSTSSRHEPGGDGEHQVVVETLRQQLRDRDADAEQRVAAMQDLLEQGQERLAVIQAESQARETQLEGLRIESSKKDLDLEVLREELEVSRQQIAGLKQLVEQGEERIRGIEGDYQDTTRKSHEDLKRKNDIEKEMQGQIDRLRKQLEQTSRDYQKSRARAQGDLDNLRDELHAERQARAEERAQMAARQRELKEQLAAVATEHEVNFGKQSDVIEEAVSAVRTEERGRLQGVLEAHAATEEQLGRVQQELQQAHAEMVVFRHQERERHQADIKLLEEQYRQAETAIKQLESQLRGLTRERDNALEEQSVLHEKINTLRGELEVTRSLMNVAAPGQVEDAVQLRRQLEEARRNVEIAVRLRAEAEAARDRLLGERDVLLAQLESGSAMQAPLHIPALDEVAAPPDRVIALPREVRPASGPAGYDAPATERVFEPGSGRGQRRFSGWLGGLIGAVVAVMIVVAGWWLLGSQQAGRDTTASSTHAQQPATPHPDQAAAVGGAGAVRPGVTPPVQVTPQPVVAPDTRQQSMSPQSVSDAGLKSGRQAVTAGPSPDRAATAASPADRNAVPSSIEHADTQMRARPARQAVLRDFSDALKNGGAGPEMVELAVAGYFMGSYGNSLNFEEGPRHLVKLPGFAIGKYEVTFAEYDRFARATGRRLPFDETWGRDERPVVNVSWSDARDYADWLTDQTGHVYRLPTEAEWEYAARGGSYWLYWWMAAEDAEATDGVWANCHNCGSQWDGASTAPVGQFPANAYGLHDLAGNVQEWVEDCYHESYDGAPQDGSAWLSPHCSQRVVRGGGYTSPLDTLRSAKRGQLDQDTRLDNLGFRVVREN